MTRQADERPNRAGLEAAELRTPVGTQPYFRPWTAACSPHDCELALGDHEATCGRCSTRYPITDGIVEFVCRGTFLVEPTTNWLIRRLTRRGLAQRVEYSGVVPDRLDVRQLRALARCHGYRLRLETLWELPVDYVAAVARRTKIPRPIVDRATFVLCAVLSFVGRPFRFGNFAVCSLTRASPAAGVNRRGSGSDGR